MELKKGDIIIIKSPLSPLGTEIQKTKPAIVVSPKEMAKFAERIIVVPLTRSIDEIYPFETLITSGPKKSKACTDQIQTVSILRVKEKWGTISEQELKDLDRALRIILQI